MEIGWLESGIQNGEDIAKKLDIKRPGQAVKQIKQAGYAFDDRRLETDPKRKSLVPDVLHTVGFAVGFAKGVTNGIFSLPDNIEIRNNSATVTQKEEQK